MEKDKPQDISRRSFLKKTATGAGAIAVTGTGLLSCKNTSTTPETVSQTSSSQQTKYPWETPPAAIPEGKITETHATDIVVIGCGVSGATASASATEAGAKVIVIEKHVTYNSRGSDNAAIDSRVQKKLGVRIDKDEVVLALQKHAGNRSDQRLLRLWADNSGRIIDWIGDMLAPAGYSTTLNYWPLPDGFDLEKEYYRQFPVVHNFSGGQSGLVETLMANAKKRGAEFRFNTRAVQLIRKDGGRVTGVVAKDSDGNFLRFNAGKAVILCTGDYGHDYEMMAAYCPTGVAFAKDSPYNPPVNTGDGHKMAMWIGGLMQPAPHPPLDHSAGGTMGCSAFLHVNSLGERYENEDTDAGAVSNAMRFQPGNCFWQIYDSKCEDEVGNLGFGFLKGEDSNAQGSGVPPGGGSGGAPPFASGGARGGATGGGPDTGQSGPPPMGEKVQADTLTDLAQKMKVPADTLIATIARYNGLAKLERDLDFGKRADRLTTIEKPPFYASQALIGFLVVLGGFFVNTKLQLLDKDRNPIQGIYLAGNTVGNRFGTDYPLLCPGLSHAFAWTTGYLSAKNAATGST